MFGMGTGGALQLSSLDILFSGILMLSQFTVCFNRYFVVTEIASSYLLAMTMGFGYG